MISSKESKTFFEMKYGFNSIIKNCQESASLLFEDLFIDYEIFEHKDIIVVEISFKLTNGKEVRGGKEMPIQPILDGMINLETEIKIMCLDAARSIIDV